MKAPRSKTLLTIIALSIARPPLDARRGRGRHQSIVGLQHQRRRSEPHPPADAPSTPTAPTTPRVNTAAFPSSIGVAVTLVEDVIIAVTVTPHATDPTSLDYQTRFAQAIPALVAAGTSTR